MNINAGIQDVVSKLAHNTMMLKFAEIKKARPRLSDSDAMALAQSDPEVMEAHRRERLALASDRRDVYAKTQVHMDTDQPGHGSASMPTVVHPSDAVRQLTHPTIPARANDLHWPTSMPPKSDAYKELEAKAERIRQRNVKLTKEQAFAQALKDHPHLYEADAVARGMRMANENAGRMLSAKL